VSRKLLIAAKTARAKTSPIWILTDVFHRILRRIFLGSSSIIARSIMRIAIRINIFSASCVRDRSFCRHHLILNLTFLVTWSSMPYSIGIVRSIVRIVTTVFIFFPCLSVSDVIVHFSTLYV
jgi:hypothetical protein